MFQTHRPDQPLAEGLCKTRRPTSSGALRFTGVKPQGQRPEDGRMWHFSAPCRIPRLGPATAAKVRRTCLRKPACGLLSVGAVFRAAAALQKKKKKNHLLCGEQPSRSLTRGDKVQGNRQSCFSISPQAKSRQARWLVTVEDGQNAQTDYKTQGRQAPRA